MVLPGVVLFPHELVPLFIFEPRYRSMLADCLENDRIFALGGPPAISSGPPVAEILGLGIVRACVLHNDGTSHLFLQGVARLRRRAFAALDPVVVVRGELLPSLPSDPQRMARRIDRLESALQGSGNEESHRLFLTAREKLPADPSGAADILCAALTTAPCARQQMLEERSPELRLDLLFNHLQTGGSTP